MTFGTTGFDFETGADFINHRKFEDSLPPDMSEAIKAYNLELKSSAFLSTWDYAVLWIPNDSNRDQVRAAYINLSKIYHTDNQETWDLQRMQEINAAKDRVDESRGWK